MMQAKVDWLSMTFPLTESIAGEGGRPVSEIVFESVNQYIDAVALATMCEGQPEELGGRAPYSNSWGWHDGSVRFFVGEKVDTVLLEMSGRGCDAVRALGIWTEVFDAAPVRATRLDVAVDIECPARPIDFVGAGMNERFKSTGLYNSDSGQTVYIGSQKSEQFCRVYRYAPPHPRSHLLRVEYVLRRDHAKAVAKALRYGALPDVVKALGDRYKWQSQWWEPEDAEYAEIGVERPEARRKNAVRWLITQVAPAFQRLVREGNIADPNSFLEEYFLKGI